MKTKLLQIVAGTVIVVCLFAGCAAPTAEQSPTSEPAIQPTTVPPAPTSEPAAATVMEMVTRVNAGDYTGAAELFASDAAIYFLGMPPTGFEFYHGRDQFQTFMEVCCTSQHFVWEVTPVFVKDGVVYANSKTWMDFTRELGVAPNEFTEAFTVEDGLITGYWSAMTTEALAKFRPKLEEVMPPAETPPPSTDTPVSDIAITIQDGTCSYDGPTVVKAGSLNVTSRAADMSGEKYAVSFFTLEEGKDFVDLMATTTNPSPPEWSRMISIKELKPGESKTYAFPVKDGSLLYMVCWADPPEWAIGQAGPFEVRP